MKESHQISDFAASASMLGSVVQINSIAIDISASAMEEMDVPRHEHFSIRGFVAGMRTKNLKTCLPFASEDINDADMVDFLPPLAVPRLRWWQCSNCVPDIAKNSTKETAETSRSDIATSSCQYVGERTSSFSHSTKNTGNKLGLKVCANDQREKSLVLAVPDENLRTIQKISAVSNKKTKVMDEEANAAQRVDISETDKPGNALSGNDTTFSALSHRRKPKLRSLADILVEVKNTLGDNPKPGVQITSSTETEANLGPQIEVDFAKATKSPERKRIVALEEDREPIFGSIFPSAAKKCKGLTLDSEKKFKRVDISETDSEGDDFTRVAQRTKPKRNKALDIRKKIKQTRTENGPGLRRELPKVSVKQTSNLQKHVVSREASFGKFGEMGAYLRSFLSGQQIQRTSNVSEKMPEVEGNNVTLTPTGKDNLDLSLDSYKGDERNSKRDIPDLNVEFCQNGKQFSAFSEKRNSPQHSNLFFQDISASTSSKEKARDGKTKLSGPTKPPRKDGSTELGALDDIPMEIVELMAKNQHERALENPYINYSPREYRPLQHPDAIYFPPLNRPNNISAISPPLKKSQPELTKPDESHFRLYTSAAQSQLRKHSFFSASTSTDLFWPPRRENASPFSFSHSIQPKSTSVSSFSGQRHGKNIFDANDKRSVIKEGRVVSGSTSIGSLDPYTNDTIPAMQLLSLMDQRVVAGSSIDKFGTNSFLDKPLSPCTHHARINGKENHNIFGGPFFPQNSHSKDFPGGRYGFHTSGESSKKVSSYLQGQGTLERGNVKANYLKGSSSIATRLAKINNLVLGVCTLNRNPADFSIPNARNEFTRCAKDSKPRKRNVPNEKLRLVNGQGMKRQRLKKDEQCSKDNRGLLL